MAYHPENLSALSHANGFTLWHYRSFDSIEVILTAGYFRAASKMLYSGDMIICNAGINTPSNSRNCILFVSHSTSPLVEIYEHPLIKDQP